MSYTLEKRVRFEASHQLPLHDGKCARLHGHSWQAVVILRGEALVPHGPKAGMLLDYGDVSAALRPLLEEYLDHHHLNDSLGLLNPTSEAIATWLYDKLRAHHVLGGVLAAVRVEETCTSAAEYRPAEYRPAEHRP
jgi:6-pyruvoyltetrahydropterin/6-carboxytetrahydropterin synthase